MKSMIIKDIALWPLQNTEILWRSKHNVLQQYKTQSSIILLRYEFKFWKMHQVHMAREWKCWGQIMNLLGLSVLGKGWKLNQIISVPLPWTFLKVSHGTDIYSIFFSCIISTARLIFKHYFYWYHFPTIKGEIFNWSNTFERVLSTWFFCHYTCTQLSTWLQ